MHSLNIIVGGPQFNRKFCDAACAMVCEETEEPAILHKSKSGDYSTGVMQNIFDLTLPPRWRMLARSVVPDDWSSFTSLEDVVGILVNIAEQHWVSIVKVNDCVFYADPIYWPRLLTEIKFRWVISSQPAAYCVVTNDSVLT